jgi:hypothetical protein
VKKKSGGKETKILEKTIIGHANYSVWTKIALYIFLHGMYVAQTIVTSAGGPICLIGHIVQYTIVKAAPYPPSEVTIVCARYIPCKKQKLWKSLLKLLLSSKALFKPLLALQTFFNF